MWIAKHAAVDPLKIIRLEFLPQVPLTPQTKPIRTREIVILMVAKTRSPKILKWLRKRKSRVRSLKLTLPIIFLKMQPIRKRSQGSIPLVLCGWCRSSLKWLKWYEDAVTNLTGTRSSSSRTLIGTRLLTRLLRCPNAEMLSSKVHITVLFSKKWVSTPPTNFNELQSRKARCLIQRKRLKRVNLKWPPPCTVLLNGVSLREEAETIVCWWDLSSSTFSKINSLGYEMAHLEPRAFQRESCSRRQWVRASTWSRGWQAWESISFWTSIGRSCSTNNPCRVPPKRNGHKLFTITNPRNDAPTEKTWSCSIRTQS